MRRRITLERLVELVDGDRELVTILIDYGVISTDNEYPPEAVDRVLVSRTLLRDLEVNLPAVDIILRLREQLAKARRQIEELQNNDDPHISLPAK